MTTLVKETTTQNVSLRQTITRLKSPLENAADKTLQALIDIILKLSTEKRAMLIELISRSMPPGYLRVSYIPPISTPPVTEKVKAKDDGLSAEMDGFLAHYAERKAKENSLKQALLDEPHHVTD